MNEQVSRYNFPNDATKSTINPALVTMQIQALQESLRRLVDQTAEPSPELTGDKPNNSQIRPDW